VTIVVHLDPSRAVDVISIKSGLPILKRLPEEILTALFLLVYYPNRASTSGIEPEGVIAVSKRNNIRDDLTGCLFVHDRNFFQVAGGLLSKSFCTLYKVPRHCGLATASATQVGIRPRAQ
jgi:hypothetical protein